MKPLRLTYDDLKNCAAFKRNAELYGEQIIRLRAMAEMGSFSLSTTSAKQRGTDRMGSIAAKLIDMENRTNNEIAMYIEHVSIVWEEINRLGDPNHRLVLSLRYIEGMVWEEIAERLHYARSTCFAMHDAALELMGIDKTV